jgi:hypothetical protein
MLHPEQSAPAGAVLPSRPAKTRAPQDDGSGIGAVDNKGSSQGGDVMQRALQLTIFSAASLCLAPAPCAAQDTVADFYRGKQVSVLVGSSAGGSASLYAQALARHMGRHLPGAPSFVVQHMPGAGGILLANTIANTARATAPPSRSPRARPRSSRCSATGMRSSTAASSTGSAPPMSSPRRALRGTPRR